MSSDVPGGKHSRGWIQHHQKAERIAQKRAGTIKAAYRESRQRARSAEMREKKPAVRLHFKRQEPRAKPVQPENKIPRRRLRLIARLRAALRVAKRMAKK